MSFWRVAPSWGGWVGVALVLTELGVCVGLVMLLLSWPISIWSFIFGLLALVAFAVLVILLYWTYGFFSLYYILDRDALRIHWAGYETIVPITDIKGVLTGDEVTGWETLPHVRWPGYRIGPGFIEDVGPVFYYSVGGGQQVLVSTETVSYAISPEDPLGFLQALELRQSLGPVHRLEPRVVGKGVFAWSFWSDSLAHRLWLCALVFNLGLFAYVSIVFADLPPVVPIHFDAQGEVDRLAPAVMVFTMPAIGMLGLVLNGWLGILLHGRQRLATLMLWGSTSVIQIYLWLATLGVTS